MEIDAAGKVGHFPPLFSPLCLRGTQTHSGARWDVIVHVPIFVLKNVHTRARIARTRLPERTGSVRPRPPFSSVPLVVPERARSWCVQPLWTAAACPEQSYSIWSPPGALMNTQQLRDTRFVENKWGYLLTGRHHSQTSAMLSSVLFKGNAVITGIHSMSKRIQFVRK